MKYLKQLFLVSLCAIFLCGFSMNISAASVKDTAKTQYKSFISKYNVGGYAIADIDQNGIPELCYYNQSSSKHCVMTYNKNTKKMQVLCSMPMGKNCCGFYSTKSHQVALVTANTGGAYWKIYKISGTKATLVKTYRSSRQYPGFTYIYKKNNSKISYAAYNKVITAINKWHTWNWYR